MTEKELLKELVADFSSENLNTLLKFKYDQHIINLKKHRKDWIKKNKCECVKTLRPDRVLNCKHINKDSQKKFDKGREQLWQLTMLSIIKKSAWLQNNPEATKNLLIQTGVIKKKPEAVQAK